ncbi:hypothetical protein [Candidatus Raskinella chloraquaticus]|uniref:hypothetical protein n=1 Tax=Candidatus Raskinella chloraquaticus TaxID=1951219 RepID=UPI00366C8334
MRQIQEARLRHLSVFLLIVLLGGCQVNRDAFPRPAIPQGASADEIERILCRQSPASPWYVPCGRGGGR